MWKFFKTMKGETEVFEELFCRYSGNLPAGAEVFFLWVRGGFSALTQISQSITIRKVVFMM